MKYMFILLPLMLFDNGCEDSKKSKTIQEAITLEYSATSRGYHYKTIINNKIISVENKRGVKPTTQACSKSDWGKLKNLLNEIDVKNISSLKAPTKKRFHDGAAIAHLKIIYGDTLYETSNFDHGIPPKQIEALVKEILSISQKVDKQ